MPTTFVKTALDMCGYRFHGDFTRVETSWFPPKATCIEDRGDGAPSVREYIPEGASASLAALSALLAFITIASFTLLAPARRPWMSALIHVSGLYCLGALAMALWPLFAILAVATPLEILAASTGLSAHVPGRAVETGLAFAILVAGAACTARLLEALTDPAGGGRAGAWRRSAVIGGALGIGTLSFHALQMAGGPQIPDPIYPGILIGGALAAMGGLWRFKAARPPRAAGVTCAILAFALATQGCSSLLPPIYRPFENGVGYAELQVARDTWEVQYVGPPTLSGLEAKEMALMRASERTRQSGARWFSIVSEERESCVPQVTVRFRIGAPEGPASLDAEALLARGRAKGLLARKY